MLSAGAEALSPSLRSRVNSAKGKHLSAHRARPFAALRVTAPDRSCSLKFIIGELLRATITVNWLIRREHGLRISTCLRRGRGGLHLRAHRTRFCYYLQGQRGH